MPAIYTPLGIYDTFLIGKLLIIQVFSGTDMPYYVYKLFPNRTCEHVNDFESYKEARELARETRANVTVQDNCNVKVVFAKDSKEAETLILTPRERPILMEHEK